MTAAPGPRSSRPRSEANYGPQRGTTYLIHIDPPYKHAKHYKGWTDRPVARRFADHLAGRGALLTRLAVQAGSRLTLARIWPNTTKDREDSIKRHGGKRMCPECGVKPAAPRLASDKPPEPDDRRPRWQYERDGEWADDGTPIIYDPSQTNAQARAEAAQHPVVLSAEDREELATLDDLQRQWNSQEEQVGLRNAVARATDAIRRQREAHERRAANREADRLWAIADELDRQMGHRPGYQHELTAERAARIRARLGEDLVQDARLEAMPRAEGQPLEHWAITPDDVAQAGREPMLQGAELDAEIDRLAAQFGEPEPDLSPEEMQAFEQAERERWAQADRDTEYMARQAAQYYGPEMADLLGIEPVDAVQAPGPEPGDDAATWSPALEVEELAAEAAPATDFPRELEARAARAEIACHLERMALAREHIAQEARNGADVGAARRQAGRYRQARATAEAEAYEAAAALQSAGLAETSADDRSASPAAQPDPAPVASIAPTGTAHIDARAERGWQADPHGVYARNPEAEAPCARRELAGYEADSPDHQYGSPQCAEADPEGAHFGRSPGEPMDATRWAPLTRAGAAERDPDLAEIFDRAEELAAEADAHETAAKEALGETGAPDHLYGSPECAEADPEGAHFGRGPGEPMDTGRWPVLQADYGRMYIGPQYQTEAEAV